MKSIISSQDKFNKLISESSCSAESLALSYAVWCCDEILEFNAEIFDPVLLKKKGKQGSIPRRLDSLGAEMFDILGCFYLIRDVHPDTLTVVYDVLRLDRSFMLTLGRMYRYSDLLTPKRYKTWMNSQATRNRRIIRHDQLLAELGYLKEGINGSVDCVN